MTTTLACPPAGTLSAWLDGELGEESQNIRTHIETCTGCREQVLAWLRAVREVQTSPVRTELTAGCLDPETLAAYAEGQLTGDDLRSAEHHLLGCAHCVGEAHRLIHLRLTIGDVGTAPAVAGGEAALRARRGRGLRDRIGSLGTFLTRPFGAAVAVSATALLFVVAAQFNAWRGDTQRVGFRSGTSVQKVEVIADEVPARARPGEEQPVVVFLARGIEAERLEEVGGWTRVELPDGRRVWTRSATLRPIGAYEFNSPGPRTTH